MGAAIVFSTLALHDERLARRRSSATFCLPREETQKTARCWSRASFCGAGTAETFLNRVAPQLAETPVRPQRSEGVGRIGRRDRAIVYACALPASARAPYVSDALASVTVTVVSTGSLWSCTTPPRRQRSGKWIVVAPLDFTHVLFSPRRMASRCCRASLWLLCVATLRDLTAAVSAPALTCSVVSTWASFCAAQYSQDAAS